MEPPRRKWRISISSALVLVLGLCAAFALIRASYVGPDHFIMVAVVMCVGGTLAALVGMLSGRKPMVGLLWGLAFVVAAGVIALLWQPNFQY